MCMKTPNSKNSSFWDSTQKKLPLLHWFTTSATESDDFFKRGSTAKCSDFQVCLLFSIYTLHSCMSLSRILMLRKIEERPNPIFCIFVKSNCSDYVLKTEN